LQTILKAVVKEVVRSGTSSQKYETWRHADEVGSGSIIPALSRDAVVDTEATEALSVNEFANEREYSYIEDLGASDPNALYISNVYKSQGTGQIRHARWEDNHRQKSSYTNSRQHAFGNSLESQDSRAITTEGLRQKAEEAAGLSTHKRMT
jgi:hypothetical protein